jgi:predicted NAD/FAD-binding protein
MTSPTTTTTPPNQSKTQRIAIIGGGVSGLSAAWHLHVNSSPDLTVELFESDSRLGGHAHTLTLDVDEVTCEEYVNGNGHVSANAATEKKKKEKQNKVDVDVGFMVYNKANYPNMTAWVSFLQSHSNVS